MKLGDNFWRKHLFTGALDRQEGLSVLQLICEEVNKWEKIIIHFREKPIIESFIRKEIQLATTHDFMQFHKKNCAS